MRILKDSTGVLATLVNCRIEKEALYCGAAVFCGGLSGNIVVANKQIFLEIEVPKSVQNSSTYQVFADVNDNLEIKYASSN